MRQVGTEKDEIAGAVISDAVADEALTVTVDDQGELELGVVVPKEGELQIHPFKCEQ